MSTEAERTHHVIYDTIAERVLHTYARSPSGRLCVAVTSSADHPFGLGSVVALRDDQVLELRDVLDAHLSERQPKATSEPDGNRAVIGRARGVVSARLIDANAPANRAWLLPPVTWEFDDFEAALAVYHLLNGLSVFCDVELRAVPTKPVAAAKKRPSARLKVIAR